jgi:hypothetical protein
MVTQLALLRIHIPGLNSAMFFMLTNPLEPVIQLQASLTRLSTMTL